MIKSTAMAEKEKNQGKSKSPEPTTKRLIWACFAETGHSRVKCETICPTAKT